MKRKAAPTLIGSQVLYLEDQIQIYPVPHVPTPPKKKNLEVKEKEDDGMVQKTIHIVDLESDNENIDPRLLDPRLLDEASDDEMNMTETTNAYGASEDEEME